MRFTAVASMSILLAAACSGSGGGGGGGAGGGAGAAGGSGGGAGAGTGGASRGGAGGGAAGAGGAAGQPGQGGGGAAAAGAGGGGGAPAPDAAPRPDGAGAPPRDGASADAGSPRNPAVYVSGGTTIRLFELNVMTGALTARGTTPAGANPSYLAWTPDRKYLYAVNEGMGRIVAFSINPATGELTRINDASSGGSGPAHLSVHKSGKWVLSSNYGSGHVAVLPIGANGGVSDPVDRQMPVPRNAHQILNDISGKFVFVPATGPNVVVQFAFDEAMGKLNPNDPATVPGGMTGDIASQPRHIAFHPNEKFAYVVNEAGCSVTGFNYNANTGKLNAIETLTALPVPRAGGMSGAHILVHPGGKYLYASMRGHNSIAIFSINENNGRITLVANENGGGTVRGPRDFGMDPTGTYLIVGNTETGTVVVFRINAADGKLMRVGDPVPAAGPSFVGVMPMP
jgi:6-phosphogluconolactonase